MSARYGSFLIYVLRRPGSDSIYKTQNGQPLKPDPQGVYWHDEGGSWTAMKPYRNVVLSWTAEEQALGDGFKRLDAVLSQLGKPADQAARRCRRKTSRAASSPPAPAATRTAPPSPPSSAASV